MTIDQIYYRDGASLPFSRRLMRLARERMYGLFVSELEPDPSTRILDLGVSDQENDEANMLEKLYPYPERITCAGLGEGRAVTSAYPGVAYVQVGAGKPLPFDDHAFDVICSNAVLEHVGGAERRRLFLREALRVARRAFITVPNRWFPLEHHTGIPFIHFSPYLFRLLLRRTSLVYWSRPENLDFLDRRTLAREWPLAGYDVKLVPTGVPLGPLSSNVALIVK
jgi:SAM-dependent methyltransferase